MKKIKLKNPEIRLKRRDDDVVVGLELEAGSVAAAELRRGESVTKLAVGSLPDGAFEDGEVADPEAVASGVRALWEEHGLGKRVRLGIANQRVVVRTLRLPAIEDPDELDSAVRFSAQEQIAMPIEKAVIEHRVVGGAPAADGAPPQLDVMVVAARREMIAAALAPLREAGLEPVGVDLSAFGMIRALGEAAHVETDPDGDGAAETPPRPTGATLYCNLGDTTNLAIAKGRSCLFTRVSPVGLEDMAHALSERAGMALDHARMWLSYVGLERPLEAFEGDPGVLAASREVIERGVESLVGELRLSLDFYGGQEAAVPVERVLACGPGATVEGLAGRLGESLGLPVAAGVPPALAGLDPASASRLTLPYGIALES